MNDPRGSRKYTRIESDALVDYTGSEVLLYHQIQNLSLGGLSIRTPTLEEVGTQVHLALNFPDFHESLELDGEVVWVHEEEPKEMGIRFNATSPEARHLLQRFIDARQNRG